MRAARQPDHAPQLQVSRMRLLLFHRSPDQPANQPRRVEANSCALAQMRKVPWHGDLLCLLAGPLGRWSLLASLFLVLSIISKCAAQPPGTPPPKLPADSGADQESDSLPIRAFMFESETGNPVMMPEISWEELERLLDLDAGIDAERQAFSYQSLEISGSAGRERAELEVVLRLAIEPTEGRSVSIPLRMDNFHRLAPPDVSGVDEYQMSLAADGSGYVLRVKTDAASEAMLRMRVSARVSSSSAARSLDFRLPDVTTKVDLETDAENVSGEVVGRGYEVIQTSLTGGGTRFTVDSGGGTFSIRWGRLAPSTENIPLFDVESRVSVRWDSPQDQPIASVRLILRSLRGSVSAFQLRLPEGCVFLEPPRLGDNGQTIELTGATSDREGELREVRIPEEEQQQRIDLNFDLQLANDNASATAPLEFRVPDVVGSLRHRGEIDIQTGGDYRLRWIAKPWVRGELGETRDEGRSYRFQFDGASFALPIWLGEKESQLRLRNNSKITVSESTASLEMTIQISGQASSGRLKFDAQSWQVSSIEDMETGEPLESDTLGSNHVVDFNSMGAEESASIRIRAEHRLEPGQGKAQFALPRVMQVDDTVLVQNSTVDIINSGRSMLVVDLEASSGLIRSAPSLSETSSDSPVSSFRVSSQDATAVVVGTMIDQPPRITLESDATIELDGQQLRTTVDWNISSLLDLEGRLPIRIPKLTPPLAHETATTEDGELAEDDPTSQVLDSDPDRIPAESAFLQPWVVTVDDVPAVLRELDGDRYELISDRLTRGTMLIRWRHAQTRRSGIADGSIESVSLPRPNIADVKFRGVMQVTLRGNQQLDLVSPASPAIKQLQLDTLPHDPVRLRLQSKASTREELSIRQTILRTVVGRNTRHEQVLAKIQGGDSFRVELPSIAREVSVEALIDGQSRPVRRDGNSLIVALPGDKKNHVVDLKIWIAAATPSTIATIEPMVKLPIGVGIVYWQIVTPRDGHIVWASPTAGRLMTWRFDDWKLSRVPSDQALASMGGSTLNPLPQGNRYLYVGSDLRSFKVIVASRVVLWMGIGAFVLFTAVMFTYFPQSRHPLTAVVAAVLFGGLLAVAPDAAVLAGQFGIIALVLVIVMIAIRSLLTSSRTDRVFAGSRGAPPATPPSTRSLKKPAEMQSPEPQSAGISATHSLPPETPTEAPS